MSGDFSDDLRQAYVVAKNEFVKYLRGKKIILVGLILLLVWGLITALPVLFNESMTATDHFTGYVSFAYLLVVIIVAMFASGAISSEYEERTALVIFTRPIKKWPIFIGKLFAALMLGIVAMVFYYLLSILAIFAYTQALPPNILLSLAFAILYIFAATGVAMMFSSLVKKSGTSAILTFFFLFLITNILYSMLAVYNIEPWYIIDYVFTHITNAVLYGTTVMPPVSQPIMEGMSVMQPGYDPLKATGVAVVWGVVTLAISYLLMRRREI
ncbi:MAG: ABC transporter permease [Candidatus Methanomethylophilaceae archaeon]|jgi:ABC-2 type transport system permease protein